ncbi:MAG: ribose 5-phosphate isomerase B [Acidaminococcaceae bacterium]|jgi:ribose 5-phosphate isomerase B|nr:ribose 5-phosphate isomerase B [Acidaminococcaceae bacterium]
MKIAIGSDHGGIHLKNYLKEYLQGKGWEVLDCGTYTEESCDYPDIAAKLCGEIAQGTVTQGILVCGTGLGMSIAANKCAGIRAAVVTDEYSAVKSKEHNNANVLCLGERVLGTGLAESLVDAWLKTEFAGGRHARRVGKIMDLGK